MTSSSGCSRFSCAQDGEPVLVGELDVHHHEVGQVLGHRLDGLGAGLRVTLDLVAGSFRRSVRRMRISGSSSTTSTERADSANRFLRQAQRVATRRFPRLEGRLTSMATRSDSVQTPVQGLTVAETCQLSYRRASHAQLGRSGSWSMSDAVRATVR